MKTQISTLIFLIVFICSAHALKTSVNSLSKLRLKAVITSNATNAFCFVNQNGTVYDLNPLYNYTKDYRITGLDYTIDFNICKQALNQCKNRSSLMTYRSTVNPSECISLSGNTTVVSQWTFTSIIII